MYDNFARVGVDEVAAGDICALTGLAAVSIGETICDPSDVRPLPTIEASRAALQPGHRPSCRTCRSAAQPLGRVPLPSILCGLPSTDLLP